MMPNRTRVAVIGTVGVPACYGGFETLAHNLVVNLNEEYDFTVYCSGAIYKGKDRVPTWNGAKLKYLPLKANGAQSILYDLISMIWAALNNDIILVLGLSGGIFIPFIKLLFGKTMIVNVDGIEWRRSKWGPVAKAYLRLAEQVASRYGDTVIADNEGIRKYLENAYNIKTSLAEYGGDQAQPVPIHEGAEEEYPFLSEKYIFKVCRIEPENNVEAILDAFIQYQEYPFVLVGNWDHSQYSRDLREKYQYYTNLFLLDPLYEPEKINLLRSNAYLYVHGHEAGGTNPSLVEAMNLGLPIIAWDVEYNRETTENEAIYFYDTVTLIDRIEHLTEARAQEVGRKMYEIGKNRYVWKEICRKYDVMFESYLNRNSKRSTIHLEKHFNRKEPTPFVE